MARTIRPGTTAARTPSPPRNENAVHDLEHGTVWITYRPGLDPSDIASLQSRLETLKSGKWMLSPYPGLPAPVVVTVWNAQLDLKGPNDPRLPVFLDFYGDGHTSPEGAFATCKGGDAHHGLRQALTLRTARTASRRRSSRTVRARR